METFLAVSDTIVLALGRVKGAAMTGLPRKVTLDSVPILNYANGCNE